MFAALGADEAGFAQLHEDLVEEPLGQVFAGHDILGPQHGVTQFGGDAEVDERTQGVFSSLGYFHERPDILQDDGTEGKLDAALPDTGAHCRKTSE